MSQSALIDGNAFKGSMNTLNRTMSFNPRTTTAGGKLNQPTRAGDRQHYTNQSKTGLQISSQSQPNADQGQPTSEVIRPSFQNKQVSSQAGKVLAINVFGLSPVEPNSKEENHNSKEYTKNLEQANRQKDGPLSDQGSNDVVSNAPMSTTGRYNHRAFQLQSQKISLGSRPFQDDIAATNNATFRPLKFKLKVDMDKSNVQPTFNCTLSECSETDFAMDGKTKGKGTLQSPLPVPFSGNPAKSDLKGNEVVQITLSTAGSEPMSNVGKYTVKSQQSEELGKVDLGRSGAKSEPQNIIHQANSLISEKTNGLSQQFGDTGKTSVFRGKEFNVTDQKINASSNVHPAIGQQENKWTLETKAVKNEDNSKQKAPTNQTLDRPGFPETEANDTSGKKLKVNKDGYQEFGPQGEVIGTSQVSTENYSQAKIKEEEAKTVSESTALTDFSRPQLRIILKSPGKISSNWNGSQLKRRLNTKRRWDQIIKSLIGKPLKTGGRSKNVLAKLSKLMKKTLKDSNDDKIGNANMPSSIAENILEANKEYLDDIAMQGMIYSDGDPEPENVNDISNTIQHGYNYLHAVPEFPQWDKLKQPVKRFPGQHKTSQKSLHNDEEKGKMVVVISPE